MSDTILKSRQHEWLWGVVAVGLVAAVLFLLRWGLHLSDLALTFDEGWIRRPIQALIAEGWSVRTAIDFEETKGPGMIWPYALLGVLLGGDIGQLRLISVVLAVACVGPLVWVARRCGVSGFGLVAVSVLWLLLPQQLVLSELLMSEPLFVLTSLALLAVFLRGLERQEDGRTTWWMIVVYALLLSFMLHSRVHAVAFAGAACLIASWRLGARSWPWWVASIAAGLSRIPLWIRWGGLVSPAYQDMHQLGSGLQLDHTMYMIAAMAPLAALLVWPALVLPMTKGNRWMVWAGGAVGAVAAVFWLPSLSSIVPVPEFVSRGGPDHAPTFLGLTASMVHVAVRRGLHEPVVMGAAVVVGSMSMGAMAALARSSKGSTAIVGWWTWWAVVLGALMYALNAGFVFDRYLLPWCAALPVLYVRWLPRWLLLAQALALFGACAASISSWLTSR